MKVQGEDSVDELQFGVETIGRFGATRPADEAQIAELVQKAIEALRLKSADRRPTLSSSHTIVPGSTRGTWHVWPSASPYF